MFSVFLQRLVALTKIRKYLDREHPHLLTEKYGWLYITAASIFIAICLIHQQPFRLSDWECEHKWCVLVWFGAIPLVLYFVIFQLLPRIFSRRFAKHNWRLRNEISTLIVFFLLSGAFNWGLAVHKLPYVYASIASFLQVELYTLELGIIPIVSICAVAAAKQARRAEKQAREEIIVIDYQESTAPPCEKILEYHRLKVEQNTIIYINKHVNSLQFHIVGEGGCEVLECLGTIKDLLPQLNDYPQLLQTHQSFIVNSRWVTHLTGNSNAMVISFANCPDKVPVSRKFVERVKKSLSNK